MWAIFRNGTTIKYNNFKNIAMSQRKNFNDPEKQLLIDLIREDKIIENKKTDSNTTILKKHAWNNLAEEFNSKSVKCKREPDQVLTARPIHRAPHGAQDLTVLDDETRCWLNDITASI